MHVFLDDFEICHLPNSGRRHEKIHILIPNKIPSSHLFWSDHVIYIFFKWKGHIFIINSDRPFINCLNGSINILLIFHKEIFEKKNNKVGKNTFYNKQKQVKKSSR
jgi:hypothetical protein